MQRWRLIVTLLSVSASGAMGQVGVKPEGALISVQAVVFNPTLKKVYVIDQRAGTVLVVEDGTGKRTVVRVGKVPEAIAVNVRTNRVYVADRASGTLTVLDGVTDDVMAMLPVGTRPFAVAVDSVTNRVAVSNTFNDVMTIVDGATNATSKLKAGGADAMLVPEKGGRVYLTGVRGHEPANSG